MRFSKHPIVQNAIKLLYNLAAMHILHSNCVTKSRRLTVNFTVLSGLRPLQQLIYISATSESFKLIGKPYAAQRHVCSACVGPQNILYNADIRAVIYAHVFLEHQARAWNILIT